MSLGLGFRDVVDDFLELVQELVVFLSGFVESGRPFKRIVVAGETVGSGVGLVSGHCGFVGLAIN